MKPPLHVLAMSTEPFLYVGEDGEIRGLEYDLLTHFAAVQGRELKIEWADGFATLLPRLAAGDADLISASLTITPERQAKFDFTSPYFPVLPLVVEVSGEESASLEELRGKRILVVRGTSHDEALKAVGGIDLVYDTTDAAMFARLAAGEAAGLATDSPAYFWNADRYPNLSPSFGFGERSYYGFALRQGDPLKDELDVFLGQIKRDGRFLEFLHSAFGAWRADAIDAMAEGMFDTGS